MTKELKILCPFCKAPYTAQMEEDLYSSMGCPTCGPNPPEGEITISCTNCGKIVYRKEIGE